MRINFKYGTAYATSMLLAELKTLIKHVTIAFDTYSGSNCNCFSEQFNLTFVSVLNDESMNA